MSEWLVLVESNTTGSGRLFCRAAGRLGLRPVLFARDPGRYPYVAADGVDHRVVDTADVQAVRSAALGLDGRIAGVTSSSEYFIAAAAEVARSFGRAHPDPAAVRACRDKYEQRVRLRAAGLPGPDFALGGTAGEVVGGATRIGLPVVVKPVAGSGSIGVRRCDSLEEVRRAASRLLDVDPARLALPPQRGVLVEQYLAGREFSVETLDEQVIGVSAKYLGAPPHFVEVGHDFPASLPPGEQAQVQAAALDALRALRLGWGAAHVEVRLSESGPRVIEVNPRLAGGMIPRLVEQAIGIDLVTHVVARAAGLAKTPTATADLAASIRFLVAPRSGRLAGVDGRDAARAVPGVVEVTMNRDPGSDIVVRHSFQDRLGYVIAAGERPDDAARAADAALRQLRPRIEVGR
jgi:biotin carboxylase